MLLLLVAIVLGGSQQDPMHTMAVGLVAAAAVGVVVAMSGTERALLPAWIAAVIAFAVLAIQTTPLPYAIWTALPGRDIAAGAIAAAGLPPSPRPLSLDPYATVGTMLALLPGLAMLAAGLVLDRGTLRLLAGCVVAGALASVLLGAIQIAGGGGYLYAETQRGAAVGLFANRNHQVDLLLIAMPLAAALGRGGRGAALAVSGILALLAAGVVAAGSRTGLVLLVPVLLAATALILLRTRGGIATTLIGAAAALLALVALATVSPVAARLLARYQGAGDDLRFGYWRDTLFAVRQYWPAGSGLGTFVPVYQTIEPLDTLSRPIVNHAHDDYIELLLELGAGAVALIAAYLVALIAALVRNARRGDAWQAAAGVAIIVPLVHSLVDYPLRTPALMAVFGLLNAIVFRAPAGRRPA